MKYKLFELLKETPTLNFKHRVIYVDDEQSNLSSLERLLWREPYYLLTTQNPFDVLDCIERFDTSLVITDQRMPGMSGVELGKEVRKRSWNTRVILVTAFPEREETIKNSLANDINRWVYKPWDDKELKKTIVDLLKEREHFDQNL